MNPDIRYFGRNSFVSTEGLIERVEEAEATEADLIKDIKKLKHNAQRYIHDIVREQIEDKKDEEHNT